MLLGLWLANGASVVHFAPWSPTPAPLCNVLGWHALTGREWDDTRRVMVWHDGQGRLVVTDLLSDAPARLTVCRRCRSRWEWMNSVLAAEVHTRG